MSHRRKKCSTASSSQREQGTTEGRNCSSPSSLSKHLLNSNFSWRCQILNPEPFTCKPDDLPLRQPPNKEFHRYCCFKAKHSISIKYYSLVGTPLTFATPFRLQNQVLYQTPVWLPRMFYLATRSFSLIPLFKML